MTRLLSPAPLAVIVVLVGLIALLVYGVAATGPDQSIERALASGERPPAPQLELPRLDGRGEGSLDDYRGRVVVLNYWASWCEPCRTESPLLERWHRRLARERGTVLGIDVLDVTSDARAFVREFGLTYPQLRDPDGATQRSFGVVAYPETIVIDRAGRIAALERGPVDEDFMRSQVAPLLGERE
jgi:cytochrome c biogenesis protein CcmG, thiol:disulfide interchange protein DsbE